MAPEDEIARVFCGISDLTTMKEFLREIFTRAELRDLSLRWQLMRMIEADVPQREIAQRLGISLCKITRGSKVLKKRGSATRRLIRGRDDLGSARGG